MSILAKTTKFKTEIKRVKKGNLFHPKIYANKNPKTPWV